MAVLSSPLDERLRVETTAGPVAFSLAEVERLEVSIGQRHLLGAALGGAAGFVAGAVLAPAFAMHGAKGGGANIGLFFLPLVTAPVGPSSARWGLRTGTV